MGRDPSLPSQDGTRPAQGGPSQRCDRFLLIFAGTGSLSLQWESPEGSEAGSCGHLYHPLSSCDTEADCVLPAASPVTSHPWPHPFGLAPHVPTELITGPQTPACPVSYRGLATPTPPAKAEHQPPASHRAPPSAGLPPQALLKSSLQCWKPPPLMGQPAEASGLAGPPGRLLGDQ